MGNILTAMGAPVAQQAINNTMTEMEERPWRAEQRGMQREQFAGSQAVNKMQIEEHQMRLQEAKKQQEYMNQSVDFRQQLLAGGISEEGADYALDKFKKMGVLDERGFGSRQKIAMTLKGLTEQKGPLNDFMNVELSAKKTVRDKAFKKWETAKEKSTNPAELDLLEKEYQKANDDVDSFGTLMGKTNEVLEAKQRMMPTIQMLKRSGELKLMPRQVSSALMAQYEKGDDKAFDEIYKEYVKESVKPEKEVTPHPPQEKEVIKNGKVYTQKFLWNSKTNTYDIPFGELVPRKEEKENKPSVFAEKWEKSIQLAKEKKGGQEPTISETAKIYKSQFGAEGLLEGLFGLGLTPPSPEGKPKPKF